MYKKFTITLLFSVVYIFLLFPMEQEGNDSREYYLIASNLMGLHSFNRPAYLDEYTNLQIKLSNLPYEEQINVISLMLDIVSEDRVLTKKVCLLVKTFLEKMENKDHLKALVMDKIIGHRIARMFNLKIFEKLQRLCSHGQSNGDSGREKEKEKEAGEGTLGLDKESAFFIEQIRYNYDLFTIDPEIAQDVLRNLLKEHFPGILLERQYKLLLGAVEYFKGEPPIAQALKKFTEEFGRLLGNQGHSIDNDSGFGSSAVSLQRVGYWGNPEEDGPPAEMQLEKREKDDLLSIPKAPQIKVIDKISGKVVGRPFMFGSFICLAFSDSMVNIYHVLKKKLLQRYKAQVKNPSFFSSHEYIIPGFACEPIQTDLPRLQTIFLYSNEQAHYLCKDDFYFPYCVSSSIDGVLEVNNVSENESYSIPNKFPVISLLVNNGMLCFASHDLLKIWDLKSKKYKKIISCISPVKSMAMPDENGILFLINDCLLGAVLNGEHVFEIPIDERGIESLSFRCDGFILGKDNGKLTFVKADKDLHPPQEIDVGIRGPITQLHSFEDIIIVQSQSPHECSILQLPLSNF